MDNPSVEDLKAMAPDEFAEYTLSVSLLHRTFRMRVGKLLLAACEIMDIKLFDNWRETTFDIDAPTANKYLKIAKRYADTPCESMGYSAQLKLCSLVGDPAMIELCRAHFEAAHLAGDKVTVLGIAAWVSKWEKDNEPGKFKEKMDEQFRKAQDEQEERERTQGNAHEQGKQYRRNKQHTDTEEQVAERQYREAILALGFGPTTAEETVEIAFSIVAKTLIQRNHPDRGGDSELAAKLNNARDVLTERFKKLKAA